jgi:hypothetical protein
VEARRLAGAARLGHLAPRQPHGEGGAECDSLGNGGAPCVLVGRPQCVEGRERVVVRRRKRDALALVQSDDAGDDAAANGSAWRQRATAS